jgi:hypothetical protein
LALPNFGQGEPTSNASQASIKTDSQTGSQLDSPDGLDSFCPQPQPHLRLACRDSLANLLQQFQTPVSKKAGDTPNQTSASVQTSVTDSNLNTQGRPPVGKDTLVDALRENHHREMSASNADSEVGDEESEEEKVQRSRLAGYGVQFASEWNMGGDSKELALALFVAAGVITVGAFVIYMPKLIYDLVQNENKHPIIHKMTGTYAYTQNDWDGGGTFSTSPELHTHLAGLKYSVAIQKPSAAIGLTIEGGYLRSRLLGLADWEPAWDFEGSYWLAGPNVEFFPRSPVGLGFEFLNGSSTSPDIGWISKAQTALRWRATPHWTYSPYIGALFYEMRFWDGYVFRRGNLNRDLTLLGGLEAAYSF